MKERKKERKKEFSIRYNNTIDNNIYISQLMTKKK